MNKMFHFCCNGYGDEITVLATSEEDAISILRRAVLSEDLGSYPIDIIKDILNALDKPETRNVRNIYYIKEIQGGILYTSTE